MVLLRTASALLAAIVVAVSPLPTAGAGGSPAGVVQQTPEARLEAEFARFAAMTDGSAGST